MRLNLKLIQSAGVKLILLICLFMFVKNSPAMAATTNLSPSIFSEFLPTMSQDTANLKTTLTQFLTSIPSGFYTLPTIEKLKDQLENPQTVLIDVREPSEYHSGHIPQAINIPLRTLTQKLEAIPRDRPVVLYCSAGYRAAMGVMTLHLLGYENIQGFPPSFMGWKNAGEAIAKA
ncbi:MAG: rhodanese-like domain-containing protein [Snowella sp.]|nr:rhodanese-like domain-containing protein [Snowella sp.]